MLDPGRGRTKIGRLFAYARDDRPSGGEVGPGSVRTDMPVLGAFALDLRPLASRLAGMFAPQSP